MTQAQELFEQDRMMRLLGAKLRPVESGGFELELPVVEKLVQKHGTCQGGALFALADAAFGITANCEGQEAVSQTCTISYLRPARLGETVIARVSHRSTVGRTSIYDVLLVTSAEEPVAEFRGIARELKKY